MKNRYLNETLRYMHMDLKLKEEDEVLLKKVVIATLFFGLIAHGFAFANIFYSHDSIIEMSSLTEYNSSSLNKISLGRFLQPLIYGFRGSLAAPWLIGCLSLIWLSLSGFLVVKMFGFKEIPLVMGIMSTSMAVISTNATYIHESDVYMLSLLFAVLTAYLLSLPAPAWILAPFTLAISCGLYQAFLSVAVVLVQMLILRSVMEGKPDRVVLKQSFFSVSVLLIGVFLYYGTYQLVLKVTGIPAQEGYNGIPNLESLWTGLQTGETGQLFLDIYRNFYDFWRFPMTGYLEMTPSANFIIGWIFVISTAVIFYQQRKSPVKIIVFLLIVLLLPFSMNISHFLSGMTHRLMEYAFGMPYLLLLLMLPQVHETIKKKFLLSGMTSIALLTLIMSNIVYGNQLYLKKEMAYDNTLLTMNRVITNLEAMDDYVVGYTPIMFVGDLEASSVVSEPYLYRHLEGGLGVYKHHFSLTYYSTYPSYFMNILCYPMKIVYDQDIRDMEEVDKMPRFPDNGYIQRIGSVIVVRLNW